MTLRKEVVDAKGHIENAKANLLAYQTRYPSGAPRVEPEISQGILEMLEVIAEAAIAAAEKERP